MDPKKENNMFSKHPSLASTSAARVAEAEKRSREPKSGKSQDGQQQQLVSMLSSLQSNFSSLLKVVKNRLSYDQTKEVAFDRLYQEMEELKQEQEINQLRPLYIDLILLIDRMNLIYHDKLNAGGQNPELVETLQTLSHEVLEILYRRGVELIVATTNVFDPKIQQIVEVIPTQIPEEDNQIIQVVRHGFKYQETVLRPEEVVIKKYQTS